EAGERDRSPLGAGVARQGRGVEERQDPASVAVGAVEGAGWIDLAVKGGRESGFRARAFDRRVEDRERGGVRRGRARSATGEVEECPYTADDEQKNDEDLHHATLGPSQRLGDTLSRRVAGRSQPPRSHSSRSTSPSQRSFHLPSRKFCSRRMPTVR